MVTSELRKEHQAILSMLDVLEAMVGRMETKRDVPLGDVQEAVRFFRVFVDTCHHTKEEVGLFPAIRQAELEQEGLITQLLSEHNQARNSLAVLERCVADNIPVANTFATTVRAYAPMLREHIRKEDDQLFPAADKVLSDKERAWIKQEFDRIERDDLGEGVHEALHEGMEELVGRYSQVS